MTCHLLLPSHNKDMRSYWSHLQAAMPKPKQAVPPHPIFRASSIFPVFHQADIATRIIFLGYWLLKRHINEITAVITLRAENGEELYRTTQTIDQPKCYRVEISEALENTHLSDKAHFTGSIEIEFYSAVPLVYPFPAVVINYYGPTFSTVVHTAQRTYNDYHDMKRNSETQVPESGFNIYADDDHEPFIGLINGIEKVENSQLVMQFYNSEEDTLIHEMELGHLAPYETRIIYPAREAKLQQFLQGRPGTGKLRFQLNWIFPRLLVGNRQKSLNALAITHSYYDCSQAEKESDYWRPNEKGWHSASLIVPAITENGHDTKIYFYPIYSPSKLSFDVEIYDKSGTFLGKSEKTLTVTSPSEDYKTISLKEVCQQLGIQEQSNLSARILANPIDSDRIPARIKIGLDIGTGLPQLPCNICTNLQPFDPSLETKPRTFRWFPLLADQKGSTAWIMSSSPAVHFEREAHIELTFYREQDAKTITRSLTLPPHGFEVIQPDDDAELSSFLNGTIGWATAVSDNPYISTYYFIEHASGIVGGDHGF